MKKRLVSVISLLIAFVMCFSLTACGRDNNDGGDNDTPDLYEAITKAIYADGLKGDMAATYKSDNDEWSGNYSAEKRYQIMRLTSSEENGEAYVVNISTGALYAEVNGECDPIYQLPETLYSRIAPILTGDIDEERAAEIIKKFSYNSKDGTATAVFDETERANALLTPILTSYKGRGNVKDLINSYLRMFSPDPANPRTLESVLDNVGEYILLNSDMEAGEVFALAEKQGIDVYELIETYMGIKLTPEMKAAMATRTLGEMVVGMNGALPSIMSAMSSGENVDMNMIIMSIFNAVFFEEVDVDNLEESVENIKDMIDVALYALKTRDVVDNVLGRENAPHEAHALYEVIVNNIKFEKLRIEIVLSFDDNDDISSITIKGDIKHSYKGNEATSELLKDNNYSLNAKLDITEYLTEPTAFEYDIPSNTIIYRQIQGDTSDTKFFQGERTVNFRMNGDNTVITSLSPFMTYDNENHCFVFDMGIVEQYYLYLFAQGNELHKIIGYAQIEGSDNTITVVLNIVPIESQSNVVVA